MQRKLREQEFTNEISLVTKPEWRWSVTTIRLLETSLTYKNVEKQISVKAKVARNISPFSYFLIIKIKLHF